MVLDAPAIFMRISKSFRALKQIITSNSESTIVSTIVFFFSDVTEVFLCRQMNIYYETVHLLFMMLPVD